MNLIVDHIEKNPFSRPGEKLVKVKAIIWHYTACPKASAKNIRDYFNNLKKQTEYKSRYASAHYAIDEKEIIEIIPTDEVAYHVGAPKNKYTEIAKSFGNISPNYYTIGIELCHDRDDGYINNATLVNAVLLTQELLSKFNLTTENLFRHYDITGKNCPKYFVENIIEWKNIKEVISGNR